MYAVEFKTKIKDGIIEIPEKFTKNLKNRVKVILLSDDAEEASSNMIETLLASPIKLPDFKPFKRDDIYDRN